MSAREVIALALSEGIRMEHSKETMAFAVTSALASAGFRILGPDEVDAVTVERCAAVAETCPDTPFFESRRWYGNLRNSIPAAIRALKGGGATLERGDEAT